jgi:hypothetical protein
MAMLVLRFGVLSFLFARHLAFGSVKSNPVEGWGMIAVVIEDLFMSATAALKLVRGALLSERGGI